MLKGVRQLSHDFRNASFDVLAVGLEDAKPKIEHQKKH